MATITPTTLFARVGTLLYGGEFISPLARELGIDLRTVQRWASGRMYPPRPIWERLSLMLAAHRDKGNALAREITDQLDKQRT